MKVLAMGKLQYQSLMACEHITFSLQSPPAPQADMVRTELEARTSTKRRSLRWAEHLRRWPLITRNGSRPSTSGTSAMALESSFREISRVDEFAPEDHILDVGSRDGRISGRLARKRHKRDRVFGSEISAEMIAWAFFHKPSDLTNLGVRGHQLRYARWVSESGMMRTWYRSAACKLGAQPACRLP